jgi:hypothetical protein
MPRPHANYSKITLPNLPCVLMLLSCKCGFVRGRLAAPPPTIYLPFCHDSPSFETMLVPLVIVIRRLETLPAQGRHVAIPSQPTRVNVL